MRSLRLPRALALVAVALALVGAGSNRLYRNDAMRVRAFEPPSGWQPAPQTSYPRLLASYSHPDGGRLTLAAQKIAPGTTAIALVALSRGPLERQGFSAIQVTADRDPARAHLEARLDGGQRLLKQLYVVDGNLGFVVSLVAPQLTAPEMSRDFETAARSLVIGAAPEAPRPDADGGVVR